MEGAVTSGVWGCQLHVGSIPSGIYVLQFELTDLAGNKTVTLTGTQLLVHNANVP